MIDPAIEMVDLEPDGFGLVNRIARAHLGTPAVELHVLHADGRIVRAVHTRDGIEPSLRGRAIDVSRAEELRVEFGVARVILVDERRLNELAEPLVAAAAARTQDEMLVRSRRAFLASPAVIVVPPVADGTWELWSSHVRRLGDDYVALIAGYTGDLCAFTLVATLREGTVRRVTSLIPVLGDARPPLSKADELVAAAETIGPVRLAVIADVEVFAEALAVRSIEPLRARAITCFGLPDS